MRRLFQPEVAKQAAIAALASAVLCYPRFSFGNQRAPIWYLEAAAFCGGFVLWAFVFAWHTQYAKRPVFTLRISWQAWMLATGAGVLMACVMHYLSDPPLRRAIPEDYPANLTQWVGMTLFSLAFTQVFLVFAPFAWSMRLFGRMTVAMTLTIMFGVMVVLMKTRASPEPFPASLAAAVLGVRFVLSLLAVGFYLRGGVLLASWCVLLVQARLLPGLLST